MTKKKTTKKTVKKKTAANPLGGLHAASGQLLDEIQSLGLVSTGDAEALTQAGEGIPGGTLSQGIKAASQWDKQLADCLAAFRSEGGDGKLSAVYEALLLWQRKLAQVSADRTGIDRALGALKKVLPFSGATVFLRDPVRDRVAPYVSHGFEVDLISRVAFDSGTGFSSWIAARRKPILYTSLHRNEAPQAEVVRSFMAVPLVVADTCLGVLTLGHPEDGAYKPASLRTLIVAGSMLAGLVQRMMADAQVARLQVFDPVSGLMTAKHIESRLEEEVTRCRELGYSMTVAALELSELAGHTARFGEEYRLRVLAEVGDLVRDWIQAPEMAGLLDQDRIWLILPGLGGGERAENRIAGLSQVLEAYSFPRRKRMTTHVAVAAYPADAESSQDLLSYADRVLQDLQLVSGCGPTTASMEAA